jgi:hypothetical protein
MESAPMESQSMLAPAPVEFKTRAGSAPRATHGAVAVTSFERTLSFGVRARSMAVTA